MSAVQRVLFFVAAWLIVLLPFLFWWNTWFGRRLSEDQIAEYLHDEKKPRHIQHALVQIGESMSRHETPVTRWYPEVVRLASHPVEQIRNTDAWVMGQDTSGAGFHETLLKMLTDPSPVVRGNAALSLVRFGDASGRPQIVTLLEPAQVMAPESGRVMDFSTVGTAIHQGGVVAKLDAAGRTVEVRAPITGRLREFTGRAGQSVGAGEKVATLDPSTEQVWEALRALYVIGQPEDIEMVRRYEREVPEIPDRIRQQAVETERAIRARH
jgi:biotin carboxyl carrier protein